MDVQLVQRELESDSDFFKHQNASYSRKKQQVQVVMNDVSAPNNRNLRALLHEAAHAVVGKEAPGMVRAVDRLAVDLLEGRANITEAHLQKPEEATVELLAANLQDEGFGARSGTLAETLVRYVKDLYYRANIAVQKSLFGEDAVGGELALKYFDNRMRQFLARDGDRMPSFIQELGGPKPTRAQIYQDQSTRALGELSEVVLGKDGLPVFPNALPEGDAILSSGVYDAPDPAGDENFSESNEQGYRPPHESRAWTHHAVYVQIETLLQELAGRTGLTRNEMKTTLRLPMDAIEKMQQIAEKVPGAKDAVLDNLTPVERDQAVQLLHRMTGKYIKRAHDLTVRSEGRIKESALSAEQELAYINTLTTDPANAALLNEDIRKHLREQFREYRKFAHQVEGDFKVEGMLEEVAREVGLLEGGKLKMHEQLEKSFKQLTGDSASPMRFAEALSALGLDFSLNPKNGGATLKEILAEMANYRNNVEFVSLSKSQQRTVAKSLDRMNNDPALRAVMVAFARGNALRMDVLGMRHLQDSGKYSELASLTNDLRTASDDRIKQLEKEVREAMGRATAKDRLKRDLVLHNARLRRHNRALAKHTKDRRIVDSVIPELRAEAAHWGDQLGVVQTFEGGPGSVFPIMDPVKGGGVKDKRLYQDWSDSAELFYAAAKTNKDWLDLNADLKDTPTYRAVEAANKQFLLDYTQKDTAAIKRNMFMRMLQPMAKLFMEMGPAEGKLVGSSMYGYQSTFRGLWTNFQPAANRWSKAYQDVVKAAGYRGLPGEFNRTVRHTILHQLETESGLSNDRQAVNFAFELTNEQLAKVGSPHKVDDKKLKNAVRKWILMERDTSSMLDAERERLGLPIQDSAAWSIDPITGKPRNEMRLKGVKQGWLTSPRRLDIAIFREANTKFTELNWFGEGGEGVFSDAFWLKETASVAEQSDIVARVGQVFAPAIADPYLRQNFFDPFMQSRTSVFKDFSSTEISQAWEDADGDMALFIANLAYTKQLDVQDVTKVVVGTLRNKAQFFRNVAGQSMGNKDSSVIGAQNFIIDSRKDSTLPAHFFEYVSFDEHSMMGHASRLAANKNFGRGGEVLEANLDRLQQRIKTRQAKASGNTKKDKADRHRHGQMLAESERLRGKLRHYFRESDSGPYEDEKIYNELVGALVGNVLNNPKTGITQFITPMLAPMTTYKGANILTIGTGLSNIKTGLGAGAQSVLQGLGYHFDLLPEYERTVAELVGGLNESGMSFREQTAVVGPGERFESSFTGKVHGLLRGTRKVLDVQVGRKGSGNRIAMRGPTGVFKWLAGLANYSTAVGQVKMVVKVSEQISKYMDAHQEWDNPDFKVTDPKVLKSMLGSGYTLNRLFGRADTVKELAEQIEQRFSMSFADFVRKQRQRKLQGKKELNYHDLSAIVQIAEDEVSMNAGLNSRPAWFFDNKLKPITMLWGWPVMQTDRVAKMATNERGEFDRRALLKMAVTMTMFAMPASLAYSMVLDLYDEFFRGKAPNLRKPDLEKGAGDNALMTVERLARMGTFGLAGDMVNSVANWNDYHGGGNPISLDDRILLMSSVHNATNAVRNWAMQGDASYATVGRPLLNAVGGNSFLQYVQLWNEATRKLGIESKDMGGILDKEGKFTKRSNVYNIVRAAAREAGLPLQQGGGFSLPSGQSMYLREMQFAALDDDREAFLENYREAVDAYQTDKENPRTYSEAVKQVKKKWGGRHPLKTLFKGKLDPTEIALLYSKMPEGNRRDVRRAVMLHERYERMVGSGAVALSPRRSRPPAAPI